ncbi:MAG: hypothetical protein ACTHKA_04685 [Anaerocolumna jejuensis]
MPREPGDWFGLCIDRFFMTLSCKKHSDEKHTTIARFPLQFSLTHQFTEFSRKLQMVSDSVQAFSVESSL